MLYKALSTPTPTPATPPAAQGGWAVWWNNTGAVTLNLYDNAALPISAAPTGNYLAPVELTLSGLPGYTFASFLSPYTSTGTILYLYTSAQTPPGEYTLTLTATAGTITTSYTFTLTVADEGTPVDQTSIVKGTGRLYGVVRKGQSGRAVMRRMAIGVNPNTTAQSRWRHIFGGIKQTWRALGPLGAANAPTNGADPQTAWLAQNLTYSAPRTPGAIVDGVQGASIPGPLATAEAYMTMVQTTMASIGKPMLPTPAVTEIAITSILPGTPDTAGGYTLTAELAYSPPTVSGQVDYTPTWPLGPVLFLITLNPPLAAGSAAAITATAQAGGLTASLSAGSITGNVSLTMTLNPETAEDGYAALVKVTIGTTVLEITPFLATGAAPLQALQPSPTFLAFTGLTVHTVYNAAYEVTGFELIPASIGTLNEYMQVNGMAVIAPFQITASPQYSSSYAAPAASTWSPIAYGTVNIQEPAQVLTAWEDAFGDLPPSGHIYFQLTAYDPVSGCVGSGVSQYSTWANGTLEGFNRAEWPGPCFQIEGGIGDQTVAEGNSITVELGFVGSPNNFGVGPSPGTPYGGNIVVTPYPPSGQGIGITFTFAPSPVNIPTGNTEQQTCVMTIAAAAGSATGGIKVSLSCSDGISTDSTSFLLTVTA